MTLGWVTSLWGITQIEKILWGMTQIYNYFMGYHSLSKIFVQIFFFMGHHSFYKKFVAKSRFFRFSRLDDITKMFRDWRQSIKFTRLPSLYIYHAPAGAWTELYRIILNYTEFYRGIFPVSWLLSRNLESGLCSVTFKCHLIKSAVCSHAVHVHSNGDKK